MNDRTDWPTLQEVTYDQVVRRIDAHPKFRSIRTRVDFWVSHVRSGVALPCAYSFFDGLSRNANVATGFRQNGKLYYATTAFGVEGDPRLRSFFYWQANQRKQNVGAFSFNIVSDLWIYSFDDESWERGYIGTFNTTVLPSYGRFKDWGTFEFPFFLGQARPLIQCFLDRSIFQPVPLPTEGPANMPWPPVFDHWWTDQFATTSSSSN